MLKRIIVVLIVCFLTTAFVPGAERALTFSVTKVNDGLDYNDLVIMQNGLTSLGYTLSSRINNVTKTQLKNQMQSSTLTTLYHTGHGDTGLILCKSGTTLKYSEVTLKCKNTIVATCLTLSQTGWKNRFSSTADNICGYTKVSYDAPTDDNLATSFLSYLGSGKSYPRAWYLSNNGISVLRDRWCVYARSGSSIVEYSARTGSLPPAADRNVQWIALDEAGKVWVDPALLVDREAAGISRLDSVSSDAFAIDYNTEVGELYAGGSMEDLRDLKAQTLLSSDEAGAVVEGKEILPQDAVLDNILVLQAREDDQPNAVDIGHVICYRREIQGIPIRSNQIEDHLVYIVDAQGQIVSKMSYWPEITPAGIDTNKGSLLSIAEAVKSAAPEISQRIKGAAKLYFPKVMQVYGTLGPYAGKRTLEPCYALLSTEGDVIVISAKTGKCY